MKQIYTVHKTFLEGALKGTAVQEQTSVIFTVGKIYGGGWTGPRYKVVAVEPLLTPKPTIPADQPHTHPTPTIQTTT